MATVGAERKPVGLEGEVVNKEGRGPRNDAAQRPCRSGRYCNNYTGVGGIRVPAHSPGKRAHGQAGNGERRLGDGGPQYRWRRDGSASNRRNPLGLTSSNADEGM